MKALAPLLVLATAALALQDFPQPDRPTEQHRWLDDLVGEWAVTSEASMGPGEEPMRFEITESVRSIGGLWILAEGSADFEGAPFTSILTLGYDPDEKAFVGTWIDSMHAHLWSYTGKLDESGERLTLETEGPAFDDPSRTAQYRDVIEKQGPDRRVLTSSVLGSDGEWTTFMRAEYVRTE